MISLPNEEQSYWAIHAPKTTYRPLGNDIEVDVIIVGGGIAGLTAAYLMKQAGFTIAVMEKNTIGSGTTGKTTGKLTVQHGLMYENMKNRLGEKTVSTYSQANQAAFDKIIGLIGKEKIDCDLKREDNFVFTTDTSKTVQFKAEAETAAGLGLPATLVTDTELPFRVSAAVKFSNQARFNAQKYVAGLAKLVHGGGSYVFERSNVTRFRDDKSVMVKANDWKVRGKKIIVATKIPAAPLAARGLYALLEYPHTSYIVAGTPKTELSGMYISPDKDHYSLLPIKDGQKNLLLIGGKNHIPGLRRPGPRYKALAGYGRKYFGIETIKYRWKAMDYMAYDEVPLVGKVYPWSQNIYACTGFKKWGLTTSMVAGLILRDIISGRKNPWAEVFDSTRTKPVLSIPYAIKKNLF